mmetsp:Transcript_32316/g.67396  ORF Transcript_32316/g.67396 Transcript_32316/m.67396 type:complete len:207 (-) Transcript_32316:13-633(-)
MEITKPPEDGFGCHERHSPPPQRAVLLVVVMVLVVVVSNSVDSVEWIEYNRVYCPRKNSRRTTRENTTAIVPRPVSICGHRPANDLDSESPIRPYKNERRIPTRAPAPHSIDSKYSQIRHSNESTIECEWLVLSWWSNGCCCCHEERIEDPPGGSHWVLDGCDLCLEFRTSFRSCYGWQAPEEAGRIPPPVPPCSHDRTMKKTIPT